MKPTHANENFTPEELHYFEELRICVIGLPDRWPDASCHELARAVGLAFDIPWVDGHWLLSFQHSWLILPTGKGHIIDVYPIGHAGAKIHPILVDGFIARKLLEFGTEGQYPLRLYDASDPPKINPRDEVVQEIRAALYMGRYMLASPRAPLKPQEISEMIRFMMRQKTIAVEELAKQTGLTPARIRKALRGGR